MIEREGGEESEGEGGRKGSDVNGTNHQLHVLAIVGWGLLVCGHLLFVHQGLLLCIGGEVVAAPGRCLLWALGHHFMGG